MFIACFCRSQEEKSYRMHGLGWKSFIYNIQTNHLLNVVIFNLDNVWLYFSQSDTDDMTYLLPSPKSVLLRVKLPDSGNERMRWGAAITDSSHNNPGVFASGPLPQIQSCQCSSLHRDKIWTDFLAFCRRWEQFYTSGRGESLILTCWWFHGWHKASEECEHLVIWSKYFLSCVFETQFLFAVVYSAAVS